MDWDELLKDVRRVENELEVKLISFSKFANNYIVESEKQRNETLYNLCNSSSVEIQQLSEKVDVFSSFNHQFHPPPPHHHHHFIILRRIFDLTGYFL